MCVCVFWWGQCRKIYAKYNFIMLYTVWLIEFIYCFETDCIIFLIKWLITTLLITFINCNVLLIVPCHIYYCVIQTLKINAKPAFVCVCVSDGRLFVRAARSHTADHRNDVILRHQRKKHTRRAHHRIIRPHAQCILYTSFCCSVCV